MELSICMIVKNEEKNLTRCLTSLTPLRNAVDSELIIVDTGSDDGTVEIAKKYTDKVYFHQWNNNFAEMRNLSFGYANGNWILMIDADEEIEDSSEMVSFLSSKTHNSYNAASIQVKSIVNAEEAITNLSTATRLLKNNGQIKFEGSVHEHMAIKGNIFSLNTIFIHYGYLNSDKDLVEKKFQRNISLLLSEVEKNPNNIHYRIYTSTQYYVHNDFHEALKHAIIAYKTLKEKKLNPKDYLFLYPKLAFCYFETNRYEEAKEICLEGLKISDEHMDLHFVLALSEMKLKNYDNAIEHYKKYLHLSQNFDKLTIKDDSVGNFSTLNRYDEVYTDIAFAYTQMSEYNSALEYIQKVNEDVNVEKIVGIYIKVFTSTKQFNKLKEFYDTKILIKSEAIIDTFILTLESSSENLTDNEWVSVLREFSIGPSQYSRFCAIRIAYIENPVIFAKLVKEFVFNFNINIPLYWDIIYYSFNLNEYVSDILSSLRDDSIRKGLNILHQRFGNFSIKALEYLKSHNTTPSFGDFKFNRNLELYILGNGALSNDEYKLILNDYIKNGLKYIYTIYNEIVYENEMIQDVKDSYEAFLIYMHHAQKVQNNDSSKYVNYLRKALRICPEMSRGIQIFLKEFEEKQNASSEFEQHKIQLKNIIRNLISSNQFDQALSIITEYKKIVKDDDEINHMESDILGTS